MKNLITYLKTLWSSMGNLQSKDVRHDRRLTVGSPSGFNSKWMLNLVSVLVLILTIGSGNVWAQTTTTYTFSSKSWEASPANWTKGKDGNAMTSGRGIQVTKGTSGANGTSPKSFTNVSKVVVTYSTNASAGAGSIAVKIGSNTASSQSVTTTGGTTDRTLTYNFSPNQTGNVKVTVTCTTNSIYVKSVAITEAASCTSITPSLSYASVGGTTLTVGSSSSGSPTITGNTGSGTVTYSSNNTSVATVNSSTGVVTAVAAGNATITASIAAKGVYCEGSATANFTITVPAYTVQFSTGTGNPTVSSRTEASAGAGITLPAGPTPACSSDGWNFAGWGYESCDDESTEPTLYIAGNKYYPSSNETLYAVYVKGKTASTNYKLISDAAQIVSGENYVIAAYYNSNDYAITAAIQSSYYIQQTAVTVNASNIIANPGATIIWQLTKETGSNVSLYNSNQSKYLYVYASSSYRNLGLYASKKQFTMTEEREAGYASTFAFKSTDYTSYYINYDASHTDFGTKTSSDENLYLYKRQYTGTYESNPTCCTDPGLAYGTGSVTKAVGDPAFTNALTNSHSVSVTYGSSQTGVATVAADGTVTIVGAGTTTITATFTGNSTYCADEASYTLTVNKADISPTLTYDPAAVTVGSTLTSFTLSGNSGSGSVSYSSSNDAIATVNSSGEVTGVAPGTVTITATIGATANYNGNTATSNTITINAAACTGAFSLHTGTKNGSDWVYNQCFTAADWGDPTHDLIYTGAFPLTNECYVGYAGGNSDHGAYWAVGGIKTYDIPNGRTLGWNSDNYYESYPGGALGTFHIYSNSGDENYYLRFKPSSYILRTGTDGTSWTSREMTVSATNSHYYETAELDLTSTLISEHAYVDLKTSGGDGHVWCNFSNDRTASGNVKVKSSVGDADGNFRGDNLKASDNGTHGKFRIDITKDVDNWKLAFVPMYRITYAANGGGSSMEPSAYAEISTTIAAAANGFTAPTGKQFNGWSDGVNTYAAGDNVTMNSNVTLTAQWADIDYTVTMAQSPSAGASLTGGTSTAHYSNTINITTTVPDGYIFSGWTSSPSVTFADASATNTSFSMPAGNVTVTANFTRADTYIDAIWNTVTAPKTGTYTRPTIADQTPGGLTDCQHLHYHFVGWITKAKYDAGTAINVPGDLVAGGSVTANGSTYYAVWEKESAGGASSYTELTDVSVLAAGDNIIITNGSDAGMKAWNSSDNNCKEAAITISAGTITSIGDACELTLGGSSGHWTFHDGTYYIYSAGSKKSGSGYNNYMKGKTVKDDACEWTISISAGVTSVVSVTNDKTPHMQYNSSNDLFSCYNTESQSPVTLYRKPGVSYEDPVASCGAEYTITIDKNNASAACSSCGAKVNANAVTLSNLVAPTWSGHQVDYYMIASADNSTKIAEADGSLAASVTDWTDGDGKWIKGTDATIYAKWKYAEYEIAYYDQGGSAFSGVHGEDYPTTHTYNTATTLVNPTKNGYNFAGWYTSSDCSTGLVTTLGATAYTSGPINLYAKWTLKTYDVTWVVNGTTIETESSVAYGTYYEELSSIPDNPADNALADCGSDKFIGWVTAEYTAEGGTKVLQYDPYAVSNSTMIDDTHHIFYAMFAKESGTAFTLDGANGSTQELLIYATVNGDNYYATGDVNGSGKLERLRPDDVGTPSTYVFTKTGTGTYSIKLKGSSKYIAYDTKTDLAKVDDPYIWTITTSNHGSWRITSGTSGRALIYQHSIAFGGYATSNITSTPASYWDLELGSSNLTNYRTGCCSETITLTVSDATSGAGGTVAMKWNNASKSSGDQVSTCSTGALVVKVTANPSYTLTAITIAGTTETITLDPSDLTTGLPSTSEMTYNVSVPALAMGTLTITPTFTRTYSVTYNLDGGETAGSTAVVNYQSGATVTLVTPDPTRSGYDFTGWTVTKDGGGNVSVSAGQFTMPTDNVTATAGWAAKTLSSISVAPTTAEVYVGQYVQIPVTYDPADILTKGYTLVSTPSFCVTTGSTNTTLKITGGRGGVTITENKIETVSIKATADNTKTASVTVTVKPLPVDHFVDLIHGEIFADHAATIVDNNLSTAYTAPGHADVDAPLEGNDCERQHLHLVGWIESEWANAHLTATMSEITSAEDNEYNPLFFEVYAPMNVSGRTYYAVWGKEVTP